MLTLSPKIPNEIESLTYCGRTETHETFHGWRKDDVDAEIKFRKIGHEVNFGHLSDGVQLPRNITIGMQMMVKRGRSKIYGLGLEVNSERF